MGLMRVQNNIVFLLLLSSSSSKAEEAVECYQRAGNLYKMAKKWSKAGHAFNEAANLHMKGGSKHDVATNYVDAANCYKKSDTNGNELIPSTFDNYHKYLNIILYIFPHFNRPILL